MEGRPGRRITSRGATPPSDAHTVPLFAGVAPDSVIRWVYSWHTPGCALVAADVPCDCGGEDEECNAVVQ